LERLCHGEATTSREEGALEPVFSQRELIDLQAMVRAVPIASSALDYVVRLTDASHAHKLVRLGASPRGAQAMVSTNSFRSARSFIGRPPPVPMSHRLVDEQRLDFLLS
jgi:MoxR-like ATPase